MDRVSVPKRSWIMSRVKGRDTRPEKVVRSPLHRLGYRFRLQCNDLSGKLDIVLWWIGTVMDFFNSEPFKLNFDRGKSLRCIVDDLVVQALQRQKDNPGTTYIGALLQHLVGAKFGIDLA